MYNTIYNNKQLSEADKIKRCQEMVKKENISISEEERLKRQFEAVLKQMKRTA